MDVNYPGRDKWLRGGQHVEVPLQLERILLTASTDTRGFPGRPRVIEGYDGAMLRRYGKCSYFMHFDLAICFGQSTPRARVSLFEGDLTAQHSKRRETP